MDKLKEYEARVTIYYKLPTIKAYDKEEALEKAKEIYWEDHVQNCIIDIDEDH